MSSYIRLITKEEYLRERLQWKKDYMRLSAEIRALKDAHRAAATGGYEAARHLQSMKDKKSNIATYWMENLEDLKKECRQSVIIQRLLAKEALRNSQ